MVRRLFSVPSPLSGDEDYLFVSFCIPDTPDWRRLVVGHIEAFTYGRNYDEQTGYIKDAQSVGREIFESMSMCKLEDIIKQQRMLTAAIVGEAVDLTDPLQLSPDAVDFTEGSATPGLVPSLISLLNVNRDIYPDMNAAEVLFEGLIGRRLSIGIPFEGTGLADIADEQLDAANVNLDTLQGRFRMADSSLFNPLNDEKNITEALETLLRRDKFTDLEFLTPNIVTVLENLFQLEGGSAILGLISGLYEWITGEPLAEIPETATTAEILMLIANAKEKASTEPQPITVETTTNVTTTCKCGGGCGGCGGGSEPPSEPGIEGDPPPTGWEPPTDDTGTEIVPGQPAYQSRKCKVANALHAQIQITVGKMKQTNFWGIPLETLVSLFGDAYLVVVSTALGYIIGEMIVPVFPFLDGIAGSTVGFIYSVVDAIIGEDVDLDDLDLKLNDPLLQEDLVCALYNADGSVSAAVNYVSVLNDAGVNVKTQGVILALFVPDILNNLFYTYTDYSDQIEAALEGYTGPVDCGVCGTHAVEDGIIVATTNNGYTVDLQSTDAGASGHVVQIHFFGWRDNTSQPVTVSYASLLGYTDWDGSNNVKSVNYRVAGSWVEYDTIAEWDSQQCCSGVALRSLTPFTVTLNLTNCVP